MEHTNVESKMLQSIGYDKETKTLEVVFKNGGKYAYHDISEGLHKELTEAESIGGFFLKNIRPFFAGVKVEQPKPEEVTA